MLQSRNRPPRPELAPPQLLLAASILMGTTLLECTPVAATAGPAKTPVSPLEAPGWPIEREWLIGGTYVEVSNDQGICPGLFRAPSCAGVSRKVIVLQILDGHYKSISLKNLSVALVVESPAGEPLLCENRERWALAELLLPESADSLQAEALVRTVGATFNGLDGPKFTRVERVSLGVGVTRERVLVGAPGRMEFTLRPLKGGNPVNPPQLQNQADPFPFLGYVSLGRADSLHVQFPEAGSNWSWSGTAGFTAPFGWSSERAEATRTDAKAPGGAPPGAPKSIRR